MKNKLPELSVFFPAYNLESQIEKTVTDAFKQIPNYSDRFEIIVVNDGSSDATGERLTDLKKKYPNLKIITHSKNLGYGAALKSGLYNSKYSWIVFTDADGQFDISELYLLVDKQKEHKADMVIGYYLSRQVSFFRKLNTFLWEIVVFMLFGLKVRDIDCGFKLISRKVINTIPKLESERGAFISSELLIKAKKAGFKIVEVGVHHYPRKEGKGTGANIDVIVKSFVDLFRLWKKLR